MQVKLYKIMCTTPSGGHWFLRSEYREGGIGGDWTEYTLYSTGEADRANSYSLKGAAELVIFSFREHHPKSLYAYRPGRGMRVQCDRLTLQVVEFVAEVKD